MTIWAGAIDFGVVHPLAFPECRGGYGPVIDTLSQIANDASFGDVEIAPVRDPECPFFGDFHPRFGHSQGRNDEPEVIEFLRQLDRRGFWKHARDRLGAQPILSMELKPNQVDNESSTAILANGKRTFTHAWAQLHLKEGTDREMAK